jgi:hypothetical protein
MIRKPARSSERAFRFLGRLSPSMLGRFAGGVVCFHAAVLEDGRSVLLMKPTGSNVVGMHWRFET